MLISGHLNYTFNQFLCPGEGECYRIHKLAKHIAYYGTTGGKLDYKTTAETENEKKMRVLNELEVQLAECFEVHF